MMRAWCTAAVLGVATLCSASCRKAAAEPSKAEAPEPADVDYSASLFIGGLDRLFIQKVGPGECVHIVLTGPGETSPDFAIETPGYFEFSDAWLSDCEHGRVEAIGGRGRVSWAAEEELCTIDVDLTLRFGGARTVRVERQQLSVENSSCPQAGA